MMMMIDDSWLFTRIAGAPSDSPPPDETTRSTLDQFVLEPLRNLWDQVVEHLPAVATSVLVLVALLIVARLVRSALMRVLRVSNLDEALAKTRIHTILNAFQKGLTPSRAIAYLAYFGVVILAWMTAADIIGLDAVRATLQAVLAYLPNLFSALLVLTLGGWLAGLASRAVGATMNELRTPYGRLLAGLTELVLLVVVVTLALDALGANVTIITSNLTIIVATSAVTVGFLFAWSMRQPAEQIIANYYARRMLQVGDRVSVGDAEGTVEAFTPVGVIVTDNVGVEHFVAARTLFSGLKRSARAKLS